MPSVSPGRQAPEQLLLRLRRIGWLFALFFTVLFAAVHWIVEDVRDAVVTLRPGTDLVARVDDAATRLDAALGVAAVSLLPVFALAWMLARRYVKRNHLQELGEASFRKSQFVTMATMEEAVRGVIAVAERKGVRVAVTGSTHAWVAADRLRVRQVTLNLLVNAVNASPRGSVVECQVEPDGPHIRVSVADAGRGIPEQELPRLISDLRQVRSARAVREGLGLDLSVCRRLIELNGGRIWAENDPAAGGN